MRPYLLEETHEVLDAIDSGESSALKTELGDLLFQVVLLAQMKNESGDFDIQAVCQAIADKMQSRHPHVFDPDHVPAADEGSVGAWEARKAKERGSDTSMMDGVPKALPALLRAHRVGEKVSRVGFDWPDLEGVRAKVAEEFSELEEAIQAGDQASIDAEYGDVLLSVANMGRFLKADPEMALRKANERFAARFRHVEQLAHQRGLELHGMPITALEELWQDAKELERGRRDNGLQPEGSQ
jgi:ATP diphosphatase